MQEWWSKVYTHLLTTQKPSLGVRRRYNRSPQRGMRGHSRISSRNNHSQNGWGHSFPGSFHGWPLSPQGESPVTGPQLPGTVSSGVSGRGPFYSPVRSDLQSCMVSSLEICLSWGRSLSRTLPVNWGVPPFSFHGLWKVCDLGHGVQRGWGGGRHDDRCQARVEKPWFLLRQVHLP